MVGSAVDTHLVISHAIIFLIIANYVSAAIIAIGYCDCHGLDSSIMKPTVPNAARHAFNGGDENIAGYEKCRGNY